MKVLDGIIDGLRGIFGGLTDCRRRHDDVISMSDIAMSAFSLFFMQSESFLSFQRALEARKGRSNCQSLFGMERIPTDNHIRKMLDAVPPQELAPAFDHVLAALRKAGGLTPFERLGGRVLIALDGTEYFVSSKLGCPRCQSRKRGKNGLEHYHSMLGASLVAPGHSLVFPLFPEFITPQDGAEKQDCERVAAKRWLDAYGAGLNALRPVYLGDDLFACQPIAEKIAGLGGDFLLTAKPESHKTLYDFIDGAELEEHHRTERKPGGKHLTYHYRWIEAVPLRDGKDAMEVNWLALTITNAAGKVTYRGSFVTSLPITTETIVEIADCARARWKIENESFNVLKNNGYHLEHNFGHGKENLAMVFVAMNLLAFACHTLCDALEPTWHEARTILRARHRLFEHVRSITAYLVFPSWQSLMTTLITGVPPPEKSDPAG